MKKLKIYFVSSGEDMATFICAYNSRQARSIYCKEVDVDFNDAYAELYKPSEDGLYHYLEDETIDRTITQEEFKNIVDSIKDPCFSPF